VEICEASASDAEALSDLLQELIAAGKRSTAGDPAFVLSHYIQHPHRLHCFVAVETGGKILGFQSLKRAHEGNPYDTPVGWGIIGTHIRPSAARKGIGSRLFTTTLTAAQQAGLPAIEAYIGEKNMPALAYYEAMGFRESRRSEGIICKAFDMRRAR
jgi:ribosomal protein S18 acetylase RimI-like enzyme